MNAFFPLSGDVAQTINPMAIWLRSANQQLGFITINNQQSGDSELERRIIEDVASYGRQLGWIMEALEVVISHADLDDVSDAERAALTQFSGLLRTVAQVKDARRPTALTPERVERFLEDLTALARSDPAAHAATVQQVRSALDGERRAE